MKASVILSTYNAPQALTLCVFGYARQNERNFELVIADDGSTEATRECIDELRAETGLELKHVWHEDDGFRKCAILNRAIEAADTDYLIFSDGDCVPRPDFVATHLELAAGGRFLSGGRVSLNEAATARVDRETIASGRLFDAAVLREARACERGRDLDKLDPIRWRATLRDVLTPTRATWNGHNASAAKSDLVAVNGFDERLGYGGEDRELGERLVRYGLRPRQIRHRAACVHLAHDRPYVDPVVERENRRIRREGRGTRTDYGIVRGAAPGRPPPE